MTFAENRTYGVPEFAGTEVNRHSGKLKGLSGYLQNHHDTKGLSRASSSSGVSQDPIFLLNFFEQQSEQKIQHISIQFFGIYQVLAAFANAFHVLQPSRIPSMRFVHHFWLTY